MGSSSTTSTRGREVCAGSFIGSDPCDAGFAGCVGGVAGIFMGCSAYRTAQAPRSESGCSPSPPPRPGVSPSPTPPPRSSVIVPRSRVTMCRATANPSPLPPAFVAEPVFVDAPAANGSPSASVSPAPSSEIEIRIVPSSTTPSRTTSPPAIPVTLHASMIDSSAFRKQSVITRKRPGAAYSRSSSDTSEWIPTPCSAVTACISSAARRTASYALRWASRGRRLLCAGGGRQDRQQIPHLRQRRFQRRQIPLRLSRTPRGRHAPHRRIHQVRHVVHRGLAARKLRPAGRVLRAAANDVALHQQLRRTPTPSAVAHVAPAATYFGHNHPSC